MGQETTYTSNDLARIFNVSSGSVKNWVELWVKQGKMQPVIRTPGGHRRFNEEHLRKIKELLQPTPLPASPQVSEVINDAGQQR